MSDVTIRRANADDTDAIVSLYQAAQCWLAAIGSDQWASNAEQKTRTNITCSIKRGECWVAEKGGVVVGTVTVDDYADADFLDTTRPPGGSTLRASNGGGPTLLR
jgi:L-amino acid N-acyltransferase YncA